MANTPVSAFAALSKIKDKRKEQLNQLGVGQSGARVDSSNSEEGAPVKVSLIHPDPLQPRKDIKESSIAELAENIKERGQLQSIWVRPHPDIPNEYMVIFGERRLRAQKYNNAKTIMANIVDLDEYDTRLVQVSENENREGISDLDKARYVSEMTKKLNVSQRKFCDDLGIPSFNYKSINEYMGVANSHSSIVELVESDVIKMRTAIILSRAYKKDAAFVIEAIKTAIANDDTLDMKWANAIQKSIKDAQSPPVVDVQEAELSNTDNDVFTGDSEQCSGQENNDGDTTNDAISDAEIAEEAPGFVDDENPHCGFDASAIEGGFTKRAASKAIVSVKVEERGHGVIALGFAPKEPNMVMVEFSTGEIAAVEIAKCEIVGFE